MKKDNKILGKILGILVVFVLMSVSVLPLVSGSDVSNIQGFDVGLSYTSVVPIKKTTFVNFDENTYLDDYAYLAALPMAVFKHENKLFSHPLLFYQDEYIITEDKERTLNARQGIDYFMEDWMSYCNGQLDQMTLINVPKSKLDPSWRAKEYSVINGDNPYDIASLIALQDWSYSDNAVIAVIDEQFEKPDIKITNKINGILPSSKIRKEPTYTLKQVNSINPVFTDFYIPEGYKYILAEAWWDLLLFLGVMIPTGDPDIQLYCKEGDGWMQTAAATKWNVLGGYQGREYIYARVYKPGSWRIGITDIPTQGDVQRNSGPLGLIQVQGSLIKAFSPEVTYQVDITLYPGVDITIPDNPPFGCRNGDFKLKWDNPNIKLGFSLIGPSGEVIHTEINESRTDSQEMHIHQLGECLEGESYSISVFAIDDVSNNVNFEIEYSWQQDMSRFESDSLTSATEGAVLASTLNAPLLYVSPLEIHKTTTDALYKLGIKNIYLVDLGGHLMKATKEKIIDIANVKEHYVEPKQIYDKICYITGSNDIIFSTVDPWTYYYLADKKVDIKPAGEYPGALFIGPAAYIAAHHGSPVLIVDNHPELSSAVVWHNEFWRRYSGYRLEYEPSVAEMVLTGRRVYRFLDEYGFVKTGRETIITVADQYEIGAPWDRMFTGIANPGRFCGTPVDTSYWISRSVFYPALIFQNPALREQVTLINGSISGRSPSGILKKPFGNTLYIQRESKEERYEFPVLCSFVGYKHRFNERASKYYGMKYQTADGLTPGESVSMEPIDQGTIEKYTGIQGSYFPDMSESEIIPLYLERGGYGVAFSTQLEAVANNLNQGVILWIHGSHGVEGGGGSTEFWDPVNKFKEKSLPIGVMNRFVGTVMDDNPWRGYEWYLGSTEEPDTMSMDIKGTIPYTNIQPRVFPALGMDWVLARKPIREFLNRVIPFIDPFKTDNLYDGVIGSISFSRHQTLFKKAVEIESLLDNLHSAGFITGICQTSNTYFHLSLIRHGSVFQVQDPWPTSWYGAIWRQSIPRDIILGHTVGEAYTRGISHVGILYLGGGKNDEPQWWWDTFENVVYFGDPNLRMFVPSTEYSDANHWKLEDVQPLRYDTKFDVNGHMPFGATSYPNAREKTDLIFGMPLIIFAILILMAALVIAILLIGKKKK